MPVEKDKQDWFVEGRRRRISVRVTFDRRRVDTVYVHDDNSPSGFVLATLTPRSEKYRGMSLDEVKKLQALEESLKSSALDERAQLRAELHGFADPLVRKARTEAKATQKGTSKTSRRRDTVKTRELERDLERDRTASMFTTTTRPHRSGTRPNISASNSSVPPPLSPMHVEPTANSSIQAAALDTTSTNVLHLKREHAENEPAAPIELQKNSMNQALREFRALLNRKSSGVHP